jgi:catechol 2,3-dioxygenase-like lactoylglutathione lyase family enzyme
MVGYVTLGTNDLPRAAAFYDALLGELGAKQVMNDGRIAIWARDTSGMLAVCTPYDGARATVGNGVMVALAGGDADGVRRLYARARELGASDEGEPGPRGDAGFYGGYFRDLDGNKLCVFCFGA